MMIFRMVTAFRISSQTLSTLRTLNINLLRELSTVPTNLLLLYCVRKNHQQVSRKYCYWNKSRNRHLLNYQSPIADKTFFIITGFKICLSSVSFWFESRRICWACLYLKVSVLTSYLSHMWKSVMIKVKHFRCIDDSRSPVTTVTCCN